MPEIIGRVFYPFEDHAFVARKSARPEIVEDRRELELPLPSGLILPQVNTTLANRWTDGTQIMTLAPGTGYRIGNADLKSINTRRNKLIRAGRNYDSTKRAHHLEIELDFTPLVNDGSMQLDEDKLLTFVGEDADFMSTFRCAVLTRGAYESPGIQWYRWVDKDEKMNLALGGGYQKIQYLDFYPLETGPLPEMVDHHLDSVTSYLQGNVLVGYGHQLAFRYTPRYFKDLSGLGVVFYNSKS